MHENENTETRDTRSMWGYALIGGKRIPTLLLAIPIGVVLGAAVGALTMVTGAAQGNIWFAVIFAVAFAGPFAGMALALLVHRNSVRDALERPDDSIETVWLHRAQSGAFTDVLLASGVFSTGLAIFPDIQLDARFAIFGVIVLAIGSAGLRFLALRRQG